MWDVETMPNIRSCTHKDCHASLAAERVTRMPLVAAAKEAAAQKAKEQKRAEREQKKAASEEQKLKEKEANGKQRKKRRQSEKKGDKQCKKAKLDAMEAAQLKADARVYRERLLKVRAATNTADAKSGSKEGERCTFDCGVSKKAWKEHMWDSDDEDNNVATRPGPDEWYAWYACDHCEEYACPDCAKIEELDEDAAFKCSKC